MNILLILHDPPYGTERSFNGLRLAQALSSKGNDVRQGNDFLRKI